LPRGGPGTDPKPQTAQDLRLGPRVGTTRL